MRRTPLRRGKPLKANRARSKKRKKECFGKQASLCRSLACCFCSARAPSHPHHVRSRGAGGTDSDCAPVCGDHHAAGHLGGFRRIELEYEVDMAEVARLLSERIKEEA